MTISSHTGKMRRTGSATIEFLPTDDPEARMFASDIVGHLFGYAHLTNTLLLPTTEEIQDPHPLAMVLLKDVLR
jgi:hypothetical protein